MFKNMKISMKLMGGFGIVLIFLAVIIGVYYYALNSSVGSFKELIDVGVEIRHLAMEVESRMLQCRRNEKDFLLRLDKKYLGKLNKNVGVIKKDSLVIIDLAGKNDLHEIKKLAEDINIYIKEYEIAFGELVTE